MGKVENLFLIDSDMHRRATICHTISTSQMHLEPFENIAEFTDINPKSGVVLVHDEPGLILELLDRLAEVGGWIPVIAFHERPSIAQIVQAIFNGAVDFIVWPFDGVELMESIERSAGRASAYGMSKLREAFARKRIQKLTERERQVLGYVAGGLSNRLIGEKLSISPRTVEIHRANMLNKLDAEHSSEAIRIAIEADLKN